MKIQEVVALLLMLPTVVVAQDFCSTATIDAMRTNYRISSSSEISDVLLESACSGSSRRSSGGLSAGYGGGQYRLLAVRRLGAASL